MERSWGRGRWRRRSSNKPPPHPPPRNPGTRRKPRPESDSCTYIRPRFTLPWPDRETIDVDPQRGKWEILRANQEVTGPLSFSSFRIVAKTMRQNNYVLTKFIFEISQNLSQYYDYLRSRVYEIAIEENNGKYSTGYLEHSLESNHDLKIHDFVQIDALKIEKSNPL